MLKDFCYRQSEKNRLKRVEDEKEKIINKIYQANPFQPFTRRIFCPACHRAFGFIRILIVRKQVGMYT